MAGFLVHEWTRLNMIITSLRLFYMLDRRLVFRDRSALVPLIFTDHPDEIASHCAIPTLDAVIGGLRSLSRWVLAGATRHWSHNCLGTVQLADRTLLLQLISDGCHAGL